MDIENELSRLLHTRDVPPPVEDPVDAVHAGMRRRRRSQRLQVLAAGVGVLALALGASLTVNERLNRTEQPAQIQPTSDPAAVPLGFSARDVSFASASAGWALGTAPCAAGSCAYLLATDDGGRSWVRREPPAAGVSGGDGSFAVDCSTQTCVSAIRFAITGEGDVVGYAFNPGLAITLDGGRTWANQPVTGSVNALAIGGGDVVRVREPQGGCPCLGVALERAPLGGSTWTTLVASTGESLASASLERLGNRLALLERGHTSGGAMDARSHVWLSTDGGSNWKSYDDPCGPLSVTEELDATQVSLAPEGVVVTLCQRRSGGATSVVVSTDSGKTYSRARAIPSPYIGTLLATPGDALLVAVSEPGSVRRRLLRSTDDGRTWTAVTRQNGSYESALLDFTSTTVGTWMGPDHRRLVRTEDGGQTWVDQPFR